MKTQEWLRVEFHCHTRASRDSINDLPDLLKTAHLSGIDRLAITDHNTIRGALKAKELDPELVIVGEEILTQQGELLAYFLESEVPSGLSAMQAIENLKKQGAFISVPHPMDRHRHGWEITELQKIIPHIDALEVFNARCFFSKANDLAFQFARCHNLPMLAGSDAHTRLELGYGITKLPYFENAHHLRQVVHQGILETRLFPPWQHALANGMLFVNYSLFWKWSTYE